MHPRSRTTRDMLQERAEDCFETDGQHPNVFFKYLEDAAKPVVPGEGPPHTARIRQQHGTTTLGFIYKGGVLLSVDSRSTMGSYVSSGNVKKVLPITDKILATIAGGAADCEFWERNLARQCRVYEQEYGKQIGVSAASKQFSAVLHSYADYDLSVGTMISGFDSDGVARMYYCDNSGSRLPGTMFSVGSGSTFAYSILENGYRYDMSDDEAIELGLRAVMHATHRDAMSGGM